MESGLVLSDLLRGLEPEMPRTWPSAPRFMESDSATSAHAEGALAHRFQITAEAVH